MKLSVIIDRVEIREEVLEFAAYMESVLRKNDWKGGWKQDSIESLFDKMKEEVKEVEVAIKEKTPFHSDDLQKEVADVANFAMMIFNNNKYKK